MAAAALAGAPQVGQNIALSATAVPHLWQNMTEKYGVLLG